MSGTRARARPRPGRPRDRARRGTRTGRAEGRPARPRDESRRAVTAALMSRGPLVVAVVVAALCALAAVTHADLRPRPLAAPARRQGDLADARHPTHADSGPGPRTARPTCCRRGSSASLLWPFWKLGGLWGLYAWRWLTTFAAFGLAWLTARRMGATGVAPLLMLVWGAILWRQRSQMRPETFAGILLMAQVLLLETRARWRRSASGRPGARERDPRGVWCRSRCCGPTRTSRTTSASSSPAPTCSTTCSSAAAARPARWRSPWPRRRWRASRTRSAGKHSSSRSSTSPCGVTSPCTCRSASCRRRFSTCTSATYSRVARVPSSPGRSSAGARAGSMWPRPCSWWCASRRRSARSASSATPRSRSRRSPRATWRTGSAACAGRRGCARPRPVRRSRRSRAWRSSRPRSPIP